MARRRKRTRKQEHAALLRSHRKDYDGLLRIQMGKCAICGKDAPPEGERRFNLDHDHYTMRLRGILCTACNRRLTTRHTIQWLEAALHYVNYPPAETYFKEILT